MNFQQVKKSYTFAHPFKRTITAHYERSGRRDALRFYLLEIKGVLPAVFPPFFHPRVLCLWNTNVAFQFQYHSHISQQVVNFQVNLFVMIGAKVCANRIKQIQHFLLIHAFNLLNGRYHLVFLLKSEILF